MRFDDTVLHRGLGATLADINQVLDEAEPGFVGPPSSESGFVGPVLPQEAADSSMPSWLPLAGIAAVIALLMMKKR